MASSARIVSRRSKLLQGIAVALIAVALAGCASSRKELTTGSIPRMSKPVEEMNSTELASAGENIGKAYEKNPKDAKIGMSYANVLRMSGKNAQALAVMQRVAIANPTDREVLAAYGKAQAAAGQLEQALATIGRAQTPDRPDWRLKSAEGAILDQLGRANEARGRYRDALDIQPNEPSILSNLGMSYVLAGDLKTAETYLRSASQQAAADSRVRQNLALVVGLQGRFDEAEQIARRELSQQQADANVAYLRSMLSQQNSWKQLADKGKPAIENGTN
ncbi:pilus assembly protein TadD [Metarhizobium album]|uniref:Pilus assembly protein TadD n=1 Tax=Metarhizobium album TaxID=2182425 RepID=A0A2U2DRX9_9HYPH|nr:tetratricopeptide repeat protein [Rhizobium album]PWE56073.1 pilus assembly protein TadD [Rhizobium album]